MATEVELSRIIRALAALAPGGQDRIPRDVATRGPFVWLGTAHTSFLISANDSWAQLGLTGRRSVPMLSTTGRVDQRTARERDLEHGLERLAAIDGLHRDQRVIREGWVFLCGTIRIDGRPVRHLVPLLTKPVALAGSFGTLVLRDAGDAEITELVTDRATARDLERRAEFGGGALPVMGGPLGPRSGDVSANVPAPDALVARLPRLLAWIHDVASAAGLPVDQVVGDLHDPATLADQPADRGLVAVVGGGLFVAEEPPGLGLAPTLDHWADRRDLAGTAFAHLYGKPGASPEAGRTRSTTPVLSPLLLTERQAAVVAAARVEPLVTVSGAPGTGKSHAVAAVAIDAVARGETVLLATQTEHAADVLAGLLERQPGPEPVVFGGSERRIALAARLAGGLGEQPGPDQERRSREQVDAASARLAWLRGAVAEMLATEDLAADTARLGADVLLARRVAPDLFDPATDLEAARELAEVAARRRGWFGGRRRRRAAVRLRSMAGASPEVEPAELQRAVAVARTYRAASRLVSQGGTTIGPLWDELERAEDELRLAFGAAVSDRVRAQATGSASARRAVAALATALRRGRASRRDELERLDGSALLRALPLWVGTLRDVDDLLPVSPGLFDLLILDEASQIDQMRAAGALLRAGRAVVVGDPNQLRHVSFVPDVAVGEVLARFGLADDSLRLDVRRNSVFDLAAGASPVRPLDEHFRSVPHLIGFSARRFYDGRLALATRHPANESLDAIELRTVAGERGEDGVNRAELEVVRQVLTDLDGQGVRDIGLVSPFRAQADAIEAMVLDSYGVEDIDRLRLRTGTVHAFQGNECEVVVLSLAIDPASPAGARRFLEDPNLFNVMVTRARRLLVVVTSVGPDVGGLLGEYLRYADQPPPPVDDTDGPDRYVDRVESELRRAGVAVRSDYPVGRHLVDLCVGTGRDAVAVECGVHPDGPEAHIARHLQLRRSGWRVLDVMPSRFDSDPVQAALWLTVELGRPS